MMGMGEPFLNYDEVLAACRTINDPDGFGLGARHDRDLDGRVGAGDRAAGRRAAAAAARALAARAQRRAAHDADAGQRRFPLARLMRACRDYRDAHRPPDLRRVPAARRGQRLRGGRRRRSPRLLGRGEGFHVNLIAYNPTAAGYRGSPPRPGRGLRRRAAPPGRRIDLPPLPRPRHRRGLRPARRGRRGGPAPGAAPRGGTISHDSRGHDGRVGDPAGPVGRPVDAMQLEQIEVPEPGPGEVLVRVMAAGVNYNGVWAAAGPAGLDLPLHRLRLPHRRVRRVRDRRTGGAGRDPLEARRRGRDPLQPELRRVRRVQRPRPDGVHAAADLGVRVELGQLRGVLPGAGPAAPAQAAAADVGGGRLLRAHLLHRLPDAGRPGPDPAGRQRAGLGRRRRPGHVRRAAVRPARGERDRGRLLRRQDRPGARPGRGRRARPARVRARPTPTPASATSTRSSASARRVREADRRRRLRRRLRARRRGHLLHQRVRVQARSARS